MVISDSPNTSFDQLFEQNNCLQFFTEGSKITDAKAVGSAWSCEQLNIIDSNSLHKSTSIFTAECLAVCKATKIALEHREKSIKIFTDSLSLIQSLKNPNFNIRMNNYILEIRANLAKFKKGNKYNANIQVFWIPAHVGIKGNEIADQTARAATEKTPENIHSQTEWTNCGAPVDKSLNLYLYT